jgi:hypothetical protein
MKDENKSEVISSELHSDDLEDLDNLITHEKDENTSVSCSRRGFLGGVGVAPFALGAISLTGGAQASDYSKHKNNGNRSRGILTPWSNNLKGRAKRAAKIRVRAALRQLKRNSKGRGRDNFLRTHENNGDERHLPNFIGNFHKGLKQNDLGEVDPKAYRLLRRALRTGQFSDLAKVPLGCADPTQQRRLVNPLAGIAWQGLGPDSHAQTVPPAPNFSSKEAAAETVEVYWGALLRDVPFDQYENSPLAYAAADELNSMAGKRDMKDVKGSITPYNLFRSGLPGSEKGPFTSQFMLLDVPYGAQPYDQTIVSRAENLDFMTEYDEWLDIQRGCAQGPGKEVFDPTRRYYYNGRTAASYVQVDALAQAYFNACIIMLTPPTTIGQFGMNAGAGGIGAPFDPNNPYFGSAVGGGVGDSSGFNGAARISEGLATFGPPQILTLLWEVSGKVAQNQWFQKWNVHRRLRPEAYGGRVHNCLRGAAEYPLHSSILNSQAVQETYNKYGSYLLPMAFPEGSPTHPSYGAGHASVAGACVTVLKAVFDENAVVSNPMQPSADGTKLVPYTGGDELTVGGELNKLAGNIGCARNFGCVHWRSDNAVSYRLGEEFAIQYMKDLAETTNEPFNGFELTTFDGKKVIV